MVRYWKTHRIVPGITTSYRDGTADAIAWDGIIHLAERKPWGTTACGIVWPVRLYQSDKPILYGCLVDNMIDEGGKTMGDGKIYAVCQNCVAEVHRRAKLPEARPVRRLYQRSTW